MARKTKTDVCTTSGDAEMILSYLRTQNRPYSAIEVSANLHNKVSKAQAVKVLQKLHENGDIGGRVVGKQAVYHALQDAAHNVTPETIATINQDIEKLQIELSGLKTNEKKARTALEALEASPRLSDLQHDIQRLEDEQKGIHAHLAALDGNDDVQLSLEERAELEQGWQYWQRHATSRRRMCRDLWGRCSEVLPDEMTETELWESLGLEGLLQ